MITLNNTIIKIKSDNLEGFCGLQINAEKNILYVNAKVLDCDGCNFTYKFNGNGNEISANFKINDAKIWTLVDPNLYTLVLEIFFKDGTNEIITENFGFRTLSKNNDFILLNGEEIFVKGYIRGAYAHEHNNLSFKNQKDFYRKNIRKAKQFGFNLIRFHSVVPEKELFEVADEEGMLIHLELRVPNDKYNNLEEMLNSKQVLIPDKFIIDTVNSLYNYPSLAVYCIGNEIKCVASQKRIYEIGKLIKTLDSSRLYLDTCAWGEAGRPLIDMDIQHMGYFFPYGAHKNMFQNTDNILVVGNHKNPLVLDGENSRISKVIRHNVPLIAHEVCHYTALRDYKKLKEKFSQNSLELPWWINEEIKTFEEKGLSEKFGELYYASKYFQKICWKRAFESMRSSKILGGFHFLQFADTDHYENSNGIVDCFDDETFITPKEFLAFNDDMVLLCDIDNYIKTSGEEINTTISLSKFKKVANSVADFYYSLSNDEEIFASGRMTDISICDMGLYEICRINLKLPNIKNGKKLTFSVKLTCENKTIVSNQWDLWVYPKKMNLGYNEFVNYEKEDIVVTNNVEKALSKLGEGKKVCLIYRSDFTRHLLHKDMKNPKYSFKATWNRFKPVIWDRGTNYGGIIDSKTLNKYGFLTEKYYDFNFSELSEDCDKIILDDFPVESKVLIYGVDKSTRDRFDACKTCFNLPEIMPDRTNRKFAYLFEIGVDDGKLLVCGLNLMGLDNNEISAVNMEDFILNYIASNEFNPTQNISLNNLSDYLKKSAQNPVKERMMTQYWELDDEPVESKQYWDESKKYLS